MGAAPKLNIVVVASRGPPEPLRFPKESGAREVQAEADENGACLLLALVITKLAVGIS